MKKIIVAADSFKGCMSSSEIGAHIRTVTHELLPAAEVTVLPISDGGEGLVEAVVKNGGFLRQEGMFCDPQCQPWSAVWPGRARKPWLNWLNAAGWVYASPAILLWLQPTAQVCKSKRL